MNNQEQSEQSDDWIRKVVQEVELTDGDGGEPVTEEKLQAFARGHLDEDEAAYVALLGASYRDWSVAIRRALVENERETRATIEVSNLERAAPKSTNRRRWLAAALALAACLLVAVFLRPSGLAGFQDGNYEVAVLSSGRVRGLEAFGEEYQRGAEQALAGDSPVPESLGALGRQLPVVRAPNADLTEAILAPYRTLVRDSQPLLRWTPLPSATEYRVEVFRLGQAAPESSATLKETQWQPTEPLARGVPYQWRVVYVTPEGEFVAPTDNDLPAVFEVLSVESLRAVEAKEAAVEGSRLLEGVVAFQAGLLDEAEVAWNELATSNPNNSAVQKLLDMLMQYRRRLAK